MHKPEPGMVLHPCSPDTGCGETEPVPVRSADIEKGGGLLPLQAGPSQVSDAARAIPTADPRRPVVVPILAAARGPRAAPGTHDPAARAQGQDPQLQAPQGRDRVSPDLRARVEALIRETTEAIEADGHPVVIHNLTINIYTGEVK